MSTTAVAVISATAGLVVGANVGLVFSRILATWGKRSEDERVAEARIMGRVEGQHDILDSPACAGCATRLGDGVRVYPARSEEEAVFHA